MVEDAGAIYDLKVKIKELKAEISSLKYYKQKVTK